jgi:RNA polymerase sigma-70 factor (ECF subfamily)
MHGTSPDAADDEHASPRSLPADGRQHTQWVRAAVDEYETPLRRYAERIVGDAETARDVVQETFVRLCRAKPEEVNGHLQAWLFSVCRNTAISIRRKEDRMTTMTIAAEMDLTAPCAPPDEVVEQGEAVLSLREGLRRLPKNQQTVVCLKFQHGLSYQQIAKRTGLSVSNVGYLMHHGLKTLRQQMRAA